MILLDTCTLLWLVTNRAELSAAAVRAIDGTPAVFVSAASAFEIGIKHRQGNLQLGSAPESWWTAAVERLNLLELSITSAVALASTALPTEILVAGRMIEHKDPGDRFIVATAATHGLTIVTPDPKIAAYPSSAVLW
ncbi:MAG: type II toxin-antitoxin system VapC family toxin [Myxococcota bacterium]